MDYKKTISPYDTVVPHILHTPTTIFFMKTQPTNIMDNKKVSSECGIYFLKTIANITFKTKTDIIKKHHMTWRKIPRAIKENLPIARKRRRRDMLTTPHGIDYKKE